MMVTSYLINHNSRVGKTHWTMSFGQTILGRCLSNLFRQIFWGRFHLYMGALLTRCSSELIWVSCVIVRSQVSLLCVLCSQVSNSCISFPVYLKCSRWFPGKICVFHFSDLYLGIFPPDFCYQSCFIFCLWGIPWLNVCDIRGWRGLNLFILCTCSASAIEETLPIVQLQCCQWNGDLKLKIAFWKSAFLQLKRYCYFCCRLCSSL